MITNKDFLCNVFQFYIDRNMDVNGGMYIDVAEDDDFNAVSEERLTGEFCSPAGGVEEGGDIWHSDPGLSSPGPQWPSPKLHLQETTDGPIVFLLPCETTTPQGIGLINIMYPCYHCQLKFRTKEIRSHYHTIHFHAIYNPEQPSLPKIHSVKLTTFVERLRKLKSVPAGEGPGIADPGKTALAVVQKGRMPFVAAAPRLWSIDGQITLPGGETWPPEGPATMDADEKLLNL
ncbi:hypothetical protein ACOMHN_030093 [Nucella lapillus]